MKILFVCENYYPHLGGAEVVFKNLAEGFVKAGHKVHLVTRRLSGTKKFEVINGVKIHRVSSFNTRYLFTFSAIPMVMKLAKNADLIQTTTFNGAPPAWLASKLCHKPVVLTIHEVWIDKWKKVTDLGLVSCLIHNFLEKMIYSLKYDKYVCVSNATREDLLKTKISPEKTLTIHNGFNYDQWDPDKIKDEQVVEIRQKLGLKDKYVYFAWGRPGPSKGYEYLIRAVPEISKRIPHSVLLLMLGNKKAYQKKYHFLMDLVKSINNNNDNSNNNNDNNTNNKNNGDDKNKDKDKNKNNIKVVPSASDEELKNYLKAADCIIIPSIAEGFGYNAIEATAMDKPVIISDAGSLPEVVSGKYQIFKSKNIIDLAEQVEKVSQGKVLKKEKKKFYWKDSIQNYLKIYKELIG